MKTSSTCIFTLIQLLNVHADVVFEQRTERESLVLTSSRQCDVSCPTSLLLYHRSARSQTTLLSMVAGHQLRLDPEHRRRLHISGDLSSPQVSVTMSDLKHSDTGLYIWELKYSRNDSDCLIVTSPTVLLVVDGGESCSSVAEYRTLLFTIATAAGLLLLTLIWLFAEKHVTRKTETSGPSTLAPIYEEMRKQQDSQNNTEASSHQQEVDFPLYANPNIRQCPENYYACPRQVKA
ncbi:uncharacterized protein LOC128750580 [Synchiropus splendidus]|uniref:uncharacterized protein LOC128750580 n=1 Tax=Synchiropus splendidus TaxID=270530 RepID=UPI00237E48DC|nr:uncharacterized protein LOC128750580 [Synchiropus splendidus]